MLWGSKPQWAGGEQPSSHHPGSPSPLTMLKPRCSPPQNHSPQRTTHTTRRRKVSDRAQERCRWSTARPRRRDAVGDTSRKPPVSPPHSTQGAPQAPCKGTDPHVPPEPSAEHPVPAPRGGRQQPGTRERGRRSRPTTTNSCVSHKGKNSARKQYSARLFPSAYCK